MAFASAFRRRRDGRYTVRLNRDLRSVLVSVAQQMGPMIDADDEATTRLFPPAYLGDDTASAEEEYRSLVDEPLRNHHHQALDVLIDTGHADTLSAEELAAWLSAIGSMRLVLGTRLDVMEEMEPPEPGRPGADEFVLYQLLSAVQNDIVEMLADELPDDGDPERTL
jgi:Domain of unknown function (DUF2017)